MTDKNNQKENDNFFNLNEKIEFTSNNYYFFKKTSKFDFFPNNRIADLRKEKGLTLQQVADAIGVGNNTISRYETGQRFPSEKTLKKLADFFNVSVWYLLGIDKVDTTGKLHLKMDELLYKSIQDSLKGNSVSPAINYFLLISDNMAISDIDKYISDLSNVNFVSKKFSFVFDDPIIRALKKYSSDAVKFDIIKKLILKSINSKNGELMQDGIYMRNFIMNYTKIVLYVEKDQSKSNKDSLLKKLKNSFVHQDFNLNKGIEK